MTFEVVATGSTGNAVIVGGSILIDIGVPFKLLERHKKDIRLVLATHQHQDHFKPRTAAALHSERPALRWGCCTWMVPLLRDAGIPPTLIDVYTPGCHYDYQGLCTVRPELLTHDVPNCGYHIFMDGEKVFFATDTGSLSGIEAKDYTLYLLEANHTRDELEARIKAKEAAGEFVYERRAARNHLSQEQAEDWLYQQMGPNSRYAFLHQHSHSSKGGRGIEP